MLPTFKSWTVHRIIDYLTLWLLSSLWNIYHSTTGYFFDPPCTFWAIVVNITCKRRLLQGISEHGRWNFFELGLKSPRRDGIACGIWQGPGAVPGFRTARLNWIVRPSSPLQRNNCATQPARHGLRDTHTHAQLDGPRRDIRTPSISLLTITTKDGVHDEDYPQSGGHLGVKNL